MTFVEQDCTIEHEGHKVTAGGAVVTDAFLIGYPDHESRNVGNIRDWHGNKIGTCRVLSSWATPRSYVSSHMFSYECFVNGVRYVGRGAGKGMSLRAKRSTRQVV